MALKLYIYPHPVLRKKSKKIEVIDKRIKDLARQMLDLMYKHDGIGLAAPQVGESIRLIVLDIGKGPIALANPEIVEKKGVSLISEGCLSLPGLTVLVKRAFFVKVKGIDVFSKQEKEYKASGLFAHDFQHEIDHLNGVLIIDYLPWWKRIKYFLSLKKKSNLL